jgi:hypothetical protein
MGLVSGKEYYFSTLEKDGRKYICIDCGPAVGDEDLAKAIELVKQSGLKISKK